MLQRHWPVSIFCLLAGLLQTFHQPALADEFLQDRIREARSIASESGTKCDNPELASPSVEKTGLCIKTKQIISGRVRVDMGARLPSGPNEVWPGAPLLPVRAGVQHEGSGIAGHLHLGMSEVSGITNPIR